MLKLETNLFTTESEAIANLSSEVDRAGERLFSGELAMTGWVDLPETMSEADLTRIKKEAARIRSIADTLVVIGIGGSYAGTYACDKMLRTPETPLTLEYAGWNLSASYHRELLARLDSASPAICVISKSGSTMETSLAFALLRDYLERRYGDQAGERILVIAGEEENPLRTEATEKGYSIFALDSDIGGRYSVLSAVGLLPLAAAGYDIRALLAGAASLRRALHTTPLSKTDCGRYAAIRNVLYRKGKRLEVFSLPEERMAVLGQWLAQLFGESEGKNGLGVFPTAVHYSTDLHSLGQFLEDGSRIFFETMVTVRDHGEDLAVPGRAHTYHESLDAVTEAVWRVRNAKKTPICRISIEKMDESSVGELLYFFEMVCAVSGLVLGVNPFDQPGVEAYKRETRAILA
jgi:glucose-6-phosphate isomerase